MINHYCNLGSPPLARERRHLVKILSTMKGITPACAGKTLTVPPLSVSGWDHPRLRGKDYPPGKTLCNMVGSPPLARERLIPDIHPYISFGITPACAGTTLIIIICLATSQDHPRLRGNDEATGAITEAGVGSPPLTRERHMLIIEDVCPARSTPADAGKTELLEFVHNADKEHPR